MAASSSAGACDGTVVYTEGSGPFAFTAMTTPGATYDTTNTTFKVSVASNADYYWRIVFTPTSSFADGITKCEKSNLTINNNP